MSYAAQPPVAVPPARRRPAAVTLAVALLWTMAAAGLTYAIGMVAVTPGVIDRFRDAASGSDTAENFITMIWLVAALALVLALLVLALVAVLGIALRRGNRLARAVSLGLCGIGLLAGCGTLAVLAAQRAGEAAPGSVSEALNGAYPGGWIGLNVAVAVAQVVAYLVVAVLLLAAPRDFFGTAWTGSTALPSFVPPGQFVASPTLGEPQSQSPSEWAAPQTKTFVTDGSEPDQFSDPHTPPKSPSNPEDEYWSRPHE